MDGNMDAGDAALGLYQVVDPKWSFVVSCDWQCRPQQEQTTTMVVQPKETAMQSKTLDEKDAEIGLYQLVDSSWNFTGSCDWQCRPEEDQTTMMAVQSAEAALQGETLDEVPRPPARTKCNVPLAESDARVGLYQMVDYRWNYVVSCDWQCKPERRLKSKAKKLEPSTAKVEKVEKTESVPLSEDDARLGLYQIVNPRWEYVVSCDWQCRPPGEAAGEMQESNKVPVSEFSSVPLPESDARLGLYQLVNPRWNFLVSCDWQCRPLGETVAETHESEGQEELEHEVEEDDLSATSLSTCREDDGRPSLFQQTGDIMLTLVGDEGEMGLVMIDELGSAADLQRLSMDVALHEQAAEQRKRELAQLVRDLGEDVCNHKQHSFNPLSIFYNNCLASCFSFRGAVIKLLFRVGDIVLGWASVRVSFMVITPLLL